MSKDKIELSAVLSKEKKKEKKSKGKSISIEVVGTLSPEIDIIILRDKK